MLPLDNVKCKFPLFYTEEYGHTFKVFVSHFCLSDCCLSSIYSHPCLLHQTQQLLHVRTPIIHHILCTPRLPEVYNPSRSVYSCPDSTRHNQPRENFFGLLGGKIEEGGEAGQCNSGVVFGDDSNIL